MLERDEIMLLIVDAAGEPLERVGPVAWSKPLRVGDVARMVDRNLRVLGVRDGPGGGRIVKAIEVPA